MTKTHEPSGLERLKKYNLMTVSQSSTAVQDPGWMYTGIEFPRRSFSSSSSTLFSISFQGLTKKATFGSAALMRKTRTRIHAWSAWLRSYFFICRPLSSVQ